MDRISNSTREIAYMYCMNEWPAIVTNADRTRQVRGVIVEVSPETLTVLTAAGDVEGFRHSDVLEISPDDRPGHLNGSE